MSVAVQGRSGTLELTGRRKWIALGVLCLATLLVALHVFMMLLALPAVTDALDATASQQLWILDIYGFLLAGPMIAMGSLGDRIGRRRLLLAAAAVFGAASVVAAYAVNPGMLIGARAMLGLAGAAIAPCTLSLIATLFPDARQRAIALGVWAGCFPVGAVIGPIVGGLLLDHFWWGSAFLIDVPVMIVLLIVGPLLLPEYRNEQAGRIDLASVALSLAAILPAIHGLKQLASHGADWSAFAALTLGASCGWIFVRRQQGLVDPLVDVRLFARRTFSVTLGSMMAYSMLTGGVMVFVTQYFQLVQGMEPLAAGLALVPGMIAMAVAFQVAPRLARRIRPGLLIPGGIAVTVVGVAVMMQATSTGVLVVAFAVECIGAAPLLTVGTNLVLASAPPAKVGAAGALMQTANELGYPLGIAVLGSVVTATYRGQMDGSGGSSLSEAIHNGADPAVLGAARTAFTSGFHLAAGITAVALTVVSILLLRTLTDRRSAS
ncbi:MFS transporter [Kribbella sp. NPDC051952]|uniref:MFS transporter n=1 Tax=Kribbella sp. NPDC051952 TaxID=3154851 RepID=UPI003441D636